MNVIIKEPKSFHLTVTIFLSFLLLISIYAMQGKYIWILYLALVLFISLSSIRLFNPPIVCRICNGYVYLWDLNSGNEDQHRIKDITDITISAVYNHDGGGPDGGPSKCHELKFKNLNGSRINSYRYPYSKKFIIFIVSQIEEAKKETSK